MNEQLDVLDLITLLSFAIAIQNLKENEEQSSSLKKHLEHQDGEYLQKSIEQNELIIEQNEEIIRLLKERNRYDK